MSQVAPVLDTTMSTSHTNDSQQKDVVMAPSTPSSTSTTAATNPPAASTDAPPAAAASTTAGEATAATTTGEQSTSYTGPARATADRMIIKLTTNLMNTYNAINEKYYANKRKRLLEQQAAAAAQKAKLGQGAALGYNEGHDDKDYNYIVQPHELFSSRYVVDHSIGKGSFGRVVKAFDTLTRKYVAIKIVKSKSAFYKQAQIELKILMSLQQDADKWNIVNVIDQFIHKNHQCIVFELLSLNLYELLKNTRFTGVSLKLIAKFGQQLLCIAEGSKVAMLDGSSKMIQDVQPGDVVYGLAAANESSSSPSNPPSFTSRRVSKILQQGSKECVELLFSDGRTLTCTADHQILTSAGEWIQAAKLIPGESKVAAGMEGMEQLQPQTPDLQWSLDLPSTLGTTLSFTTPQEQARTHSFARLAGLIGSHTQHLTHQMDRALLHQDLQALGLPIVEPSEFPASLHHAAASFTSSLLTQPSCPVSIVLEFLGALLGQSFQSDSSSLRFLTPCTIDPVALQTMLRRCGVPDSTIEPAPTTSLHHHIVTIHSKHAHLDFARAIGLRYAVANQLTLTILATQQRSEVFRGGKDASLNSSSYLLTKHSSSTLPLYTLSLLSRRNVGVRRVYDLVVPSGDAHSDSFIVDGVMVHNCTLGYLGSKERGDKRIIHCDLKPENILLRSCKKSALKVIDFGSACFANQKTYTYIQSRFYRAPEILLGLSYNGAIDMWSLGCILVEMHTGKPLFDGQDESDQMVKQVEILGVPPRHMLEKNRKAEKFFEISQSTGQYRLKSKFAPRSGGSLRLSLGYKREDTDLYRQFEDLIANMLIYDPLKRIRPSQALQHPFFTAVAGLIAGENAAAAGNAAAAAAAASSSSSTQPANGNAISSLPTKPSQPSQDVTMASSPQASSGSQAMDTSSPGNAADRVQRDAQQAAMQQAQKFAFMQQQQMLHHHAHAQQRSGSRKRPHSNPVFGASAAQYQHAPVQPLDPHVQQALLAQAASKPSQPPAPAAVVQPQTQLNNLMTDDTTTVSSSDAATASDSVNMEDSQPDPTSTSIAAPVTPSKHSMVTRSGVSAKKDSTQAAGSSDSSGRSTPDASLKPDASTSTTANASAASSPKGSSGQNDQPMEDVSDPSDSSAAPDSSKTNSGGKRKNKRGKKSQAGGASASGNPNGSEGEEANQMSRMSLDLDHTAQAATSGVRTRSHANQ